MRRILVIGIGAGNPDHLTLQAIRALGQVDVVFVMDKGRVKEDLVGLRTLICERHIRDRTYRVVEITDPVRDPAISAYQARVEAWHEQRAALYEETIARELGEQQCGGVLVWGDPSLYDSTLRILDRLVQRGNLALEYEVIPGITSVQALAASHRITLNRIGGSILVTTGRKLSEAGLPANAEDIVVMLDGDCAFQKLPDAGLDIYWGAYLGTADEILLAGKLSERKDEIQRVRGAAREKHGWIMDIYLLRKRSPTGDSGA